MARRRRPLLTPSSILEEQEREEQTPLVFSFDPRPPNPGTIRYLHFSPRDTPWYLMRWTYTDMSLTKWITKIDKIADMSLNTFPGCVYPKSYQEEVWSLFYKMQRERWLARWAIMRWRYRMWSKRTQCNVDLIDMEPVPDRDAIYLTDTKAGHLYRFHRRDIIQNFMSNICMADEMLPTPRSPTNPWTNAALTFGQLLSISQQIAADFTRRGSCPPTLFAAFWAARFNIKRFQEENSAVLAQHATMDYFKDITPANLDTVYDTIMQLLDQALDAEVQYSPVAIRRWLTQKPITSAHRNWLRLVRDYTLYINLHVQIRPHWFNDEWINRDVRALFNATTFPNPRPERLQLAMAPLHQPQTTSQFIAAMVLGPTYGMPVIPTTSYQELAVAPDPLLDLSGSEVDQLTITALLELLQSSVFRL
jgi:hypothetical protein